MKQKWEDHSTKKSYAFLNQAQSNAIASKYIKQKCIEVEEDSMNIIKHVHYSM